jgi:NAD(P)-dependent dehydrogenase (short-subunit alcohol dehydrogenase family)
MTSQSLIGKAVLVTGGARRIGREIALELAAAGADLTITYRNSKTEAEENLQLIHQLGRVAIAI